MVSDNIFTELAKSFISGGEGEIADIVTFAEASWGLNIRLLPSQKFILRAFYSLPLDDTDAYIPVANLTNERVLYTFTEKEFLHWLYEEGKCNTDVTEGKKFQELILSLGRRSSKCRDSDDLIATTEGSITFGELLTRLNRGDRIGIPTYDPDTLTRSISYDIKAKANDDTECFEVETARGIREISSWNHPYLVWRDGWEKPGFVEMSRLQPGDKIASSACLGVFGRGEIGVRKAALLGHLQGDGGITCQVSYTTASETMLNDIRRLVDVEFPGYVVKKKGKASFRLGYDIVKESGRFKQNGGQKNEVKEWLIRMGCFGKKSIEKSVPSCILRGNREEVAAFLSRLFGCDGHASVKKIYRGHRIPGSHIGYGSSSQKMVDGVRHLLLKFGIYCSVIKFMASCNGKKFETWKLSIADRKSVEKFASEIGIFSKEDAVEKVVKAASLRGTEKNEFDCIPRGVWGYVKRIMRERPLSAADIIGKRSSETWTWSPSRRKVASYGVNACDDFLLSMGTSDVKWDDVKSLRPVGRRKTVDVEVAKTHIIGGDLVSHNSTIAAIISNYELYKLVRRGDPVKYYGFNPGTQFYVLNVAPTDDQAAVVFDMMQSQSSGCPYLRDRSLHNTMTYFDIQTDADMEKGNQNPKASIIILSGGCSSNALRGRNAIVVVMDEMAYFLDNSGRFSGSEVYKALTPSVASFGTDGKVLSISSPYAKYGAFYERWLQSFHETEITLSFKMHSAMANPDNVGTALLKAAKRRDRNSFMCEYGAEFSDAVVAWVDDADEFKRCVVNDAPPTRGLSDIKYFMGIDLGFKNDGAAISIVHRDPRSGKVILDFADVWFSGASDVWDFEDSIYQGCRKYADQDLLKMSDIVNEIKALSRWFPIQKGIFDQSNGYALAELLKAEGFPQIEMESFTDKKNHEVYELTKRLYAEQLVQLYDHPVLIPEILTLEGEKVSKNIIVVRAPNRRGAHDDISDSFSRAVWLCHRTFKKQAPHIATGAGGATAGMGAIGIFRGPPELQVKQVTMRSFQLQRHKMHGEHPRLGLPKRRMPGAVR